MFMILMSYIDAIYTLYRVYKYIKNYPYALTVSFLRLNHREYLHICQKKHIKDNSS